jgi:extracellular elastinolytic metalloproteinase
MSSRVSTVIAHEYCHGLSIRLTGGPSTSGCLYQEQAGEGWSDYCALFFTSKSTNERIRTIGSYVTGRANGIRRYPYSNDMLINPLTYNAVGTNALSVPHGIGSFFATVLWDITLGIMDYEKEQCRPDFNPNKKETTIGGNNIAFQLVVDGLKFQPCGPTFVDSRDAILTADESRGGEYHCLLWKAFARRGLGMNAVSPNNCAVGCNGFGVRQPVESFDVPANCVPDLPPGPCVVESPAISPRPTSSPSMQPPVSSCVGSRESCANAETCCPGLSCKRNGRWAGTCA